jgi:hypothetical protein
LDNGTYASFDKGTTWHLFNKMLNVASYDMIVHPRDNELVVGTHGRSIFVADVKPLQSLKEGAVTKGMLAFAPESIRHSDRWGEKQYPWAEAYEPEVAVFYYVGKPAQHIQVEVYDEKNTLIRKLNGNGSVGFHTLGWNVKTEQVSADGKKVKSKTVAPAEWKYVSKGKYKIKLINGTEHSEVNLEIK